MGNAARLLKAWEQGEFELIASPALLEELQRALAYPKLRRRISEQDAESVVRWLNESATLANDPTEAPPIRSRDPGDDYLIALAASRQAILVSGDHHLLDLFQPSTRPPSSNTSQNEKTTSSARRSSCDGLPNATRQRLAQALQGIGQSLAVAKLAIRPSSRDGDTSLPVCR